MTNESVAIAISRAEPKHKSVVANLVQLYLYDMTEDLPFAIGQDGRFQYDFLERFWQHPYLIFCREELAGFALVIDGSPVTNTPDCFFMAEFFVLKAYRNKGVAAAAFRQILDNHTGKWQIGVIERNKGANAFWNRVLDPQRPSLFHQRFDGEDWRVYEFTKS